jgi:predicted amidophosphoribosyltransferase
MRLCPCPELDIDPADDEEVCQTCGHARDEHSDVDGECLVDMDPWEEDR